MSDIKAWLHSHEFRGKIADRFRCKNGLFDIMRYDI